jgi:predicted  nucleic acid-binding Zn-ribbon protein
MINIEENDLMPEIEQQLALINEETDALENDLKAFKNIYEELKQLRSENQDLKERLNTAETDINNVNEKMKERDKVLHVLLAEVKKLHAKMREIRSSVNSNS